MSYPEFQQFALVRDTLLDDIEDMPSAVVTYGKDRRCGDVALICMSDSNRLYYISYGKDYIGYNMTFNMIENVHGGRGDVYYRRIHVQGDIEMVIGAIEDKLGEPILI